MAGEAMGKPTKPEFEPVAERSQWRHGAGGGGAARAEEGEYGHEAANEPAAWGGDIAGVECGREILGEQRVRHQRGQGEVDDEGTEPADEVPASLRQISGSRRSRVR